MADDVTDIPSNIIKGPRKDSFAVERKSSVVTNSSPATRKESVNRELAAIFQISGHSYDVSLSESRISWSSVSGSGKGPRLKKKRSFLQKLKGAKEYDEDKTSTEKDGVVLERVLGAVVRRQMHGKKEGEGVCQGIGLYTFEKRDPNKHRPRMLLLEHPSEDLCTLWCNKINDLLKEIKHNEHVKHDFAHINLDDFDSVVCLGGDGTVSQVVNNLLDKAQQQAHVTIRPHFQPAKCALPLCVIPCGTVNQLAHSVMGISDPETAVIHYILGNRQSVDVCSTFAADQFSTWSFNCHYGFFGSVLRYTPRYTIMGEKKLEVCFAKALTKSKFRSFDCDIQYIPAFDTPTGFEPDTVHSVCRTGYGCSAGPPAEYCTRCCWCRCTACGGGGVRCSSTYSDEVQVLDPLQTSDASSALADFSRESPWRALKGSYLSVSVLTVPGLSFLAPRGMGPFTHLCNGHIDLVLVEQADRREFVRYLRRHGNRKNQMAFPFVRAVRCKEVKFQARQKETWRHVDHDFNEIDYEMDRVKNRRQSGIQRTQSAQVIADLGEFSSGDEDEGSADTEKKPKKKSQQLFGRWEMNMTSEKKTAIEKGIVANSLQRVDDVRSEPLGDAEGNDAGAKDTREGSGSSRYKPSLYEQEVERRSKMKRATDERREEKAREKMTSVWNIDNELSTHSQDLHFTVHHGLLTLFGQGIHPDSDPDDITYSCLNIF